MHGPDSILIVDDDAEIRSLLASYLGKNGYRSMTAADGREMRRVLDRQSVDLIVLDLMLPGEDGLELCRELRARSNIPVVMITGQCEKPTLRKALNLGADDYVVKPFSSAELVARIRAKLRRAEQAASGHQYNAA